MCGIIPFSLTMFGVGNQVMAHQIRAAGILEAGNAVQIGRGYIPAAAAEGFRQGLLFAQLTGGAAQLTGRKLVIGVRTQPVNAGNGLVFVERHRTGTAHQLCAHGDFLYVVSGERNTVVAAPSVQLLAEAFQHQLLHRQPVAVTEAAVALFFQKQQTQSVADVFTVFAAEIFLQHGRIGRIRPIVLGLVGEKAFQIRGKCASKPLFVLLVGHIQEFAHHLGIEDVHGGSGAVHVYVKVFAAGILIGADQGGFGDFVGYVGLGIECTLRLGQIHIPIQNILQQKTTGKAAGPAVFVVSPSVHTQLFGLVAAGFDALHPLLA